MSSRFPNWQVTLSRFPARFEYQALTLLVVFDVVAVAGLLGLSIPFVQPVLAFVLTGVVLGGLFLLVVGVDPRVHLRWFAYALGSGLILLLVGGTAVNAALPIVGYDRPLTAVPMLLTLNALIVSLAYVALQRARPAVLDLRSAVSRRHFEPSFLLFLSIPVWTVLAITYLNVTHDTTAIIAMLLLIAVLPMYVVVFEVPERYYPVAIGGMALAILYHKNLWVSSNYGGHTSVVEIWSSGLWDFSGESLAVNAVLMPAMGHLSGVHILTFMAVLFPLLVVFVPLGMYLNFRAYVDAETAFLGAVMFVFAHPFYYQYPDNPRAAIPVLFLVLLGSVMSDPDNSRFQRYLLALLFGFGIISSHYGTSYYVMFALVGALFVMRSYDVVEWIFSRVAVARETVLDWIDRGDSEDLGGDREVVLTRTFVVYYVTTVIAYYYFVDDGTVYELLVDQVFAAYLDLIVGTEEGGGATATRLTTDYGGLSIEYSKQLYTLLAIMVAVGLVVVHWDRFVRDRDTGFDDDFLSFAGLLLFMFGGTIVVSGNWGGGRPMMIVFSFNAIFAVLGMTWGARTLQRVGSPLDGSVVSLPSLSTDDVALAGRAAFAVLLATFFVLNSGTMAALAYGGEAPSEVPSTDLDESTDDTDLAAHVFVTDYRSVNETIYGDRGTRQQATDWHSGEIDAATERGAYRFQASNDLTAVNASSGLTSGYMILLGHNVVKDYVNVNYVVNRPIEEYDLREDDRHRVYTNGQAHLFYTDETTLNLASQPSGGGR